jgi:hypothetical protein
MSYYTSVITSLDITIQTLLMQYSVENAGGGRKNKLTKKRGEKGLAPQAPHKVGPKDADRPHDPRPPVVGAVASNYFRIRARLPTPDFGLRDGMATVTLDARTISHECRP